MSLLVLLWKLGLMCRILRRVIGLDVSTLIAAAVSLESAKGGIILIGGTGKCPDCKAGKPIYCDAPKMKGITADGAWAEYMVA